MMCEKSDLIIETSSRKTIFPLFSISMFAIVFFTAWIELHGEEWKKNRQYDIIPDLACPPAPSQGPIRISTSQYQNF